MNETALTNENFETRTQKILQVAKHLYQSNPDWVTFFREVLGVDGAARSVFPDQNDYVKFEKTPQYDEVQTMVTNLRNRKIPGGGHNEATRVITVRLPESLHEALKAEAADHKTSMNKLCISKLLQVLSGAEPPTRGIFVERDSSSANSSSMGQNPTPQPAIAFQVPAQVPTQTAAQTPAQPTATSQQPGSTNMPAPSPNPGTQNPSRFGNNY